MRTHAEKRVAVAGDGGSDAEATTRSRGARCDGSWEDVVDGMGTIVAARCDTQALRRSPVPAVLTAPCLRTSVPPAATVSAA